MITLAALTLTSVPGQSLPVIAAEDQIITINPQFFSSVEIKELAAIAQPGPDSTVELAIYRVQCTYPPQFIESAWRQHPPLLFFITGQEVISFRKHTAGMCNLMIDD